MATATNNTNTTNTVAWAARSDGGIIFLVEEKNGRPRLRAIFEAVRGDTLYRVALGRRTAKGGATPFGRVDSGTALQAVVVSSKRRNDCSPGLRSFVRRQLVSAKSNVHAFDLADVRRLVFHDQEPVELLSIDSKGSIDKKPLAGFSRDGSYKLASMGVGSVAGLFADVQLLQSSYVVSKDSLISKAIDAFEGRAQKATPIPRVDEVVVPKAQPEPVNQELDELVKNQFAELPLIGEEAGVEVVDYVRHLHAVEAPSLVDEEAALEAEGL